MDSFSVTVKKNGIGLNKCKIALPLEITHGRSGTDSQPDAPTCTFTWLDDMSPIEMGDTIEVEVAGTLEGQWADPDVLWADVNVSWSGLTGYSKRFVGSVTSMKAIESNGLVTSWEIEATGDQAKLGRIPITLNRPQESDVDRVQAIAAAAGITIEIVGAAGPDLVPDAIDRDALSALHEVCESSGGIIWQQRDGTITYGTMNRSAVAPNWRVVCDMVVDGVEWTRDTGTVLNHVTVKFGPESNLRFQTGEWRLDTDTTMADPTAGRVRMNGTSASTTTIIAVSSLTWDGADASLVLDALVVNSSLIGQQKDDADLYARWRVAGTPTDHGTWWEIPVLFVESGSGSGVNKNTQVLLDFGIQFRQQQDTFRDDPSITEWGYRHVDVDTQCASLADATLLATAILARRKQPRWVMPGVLVLREKATDAEWVPIALMDFGHTVGIDVETAPSATPGTITAWTVEGWVETWEPAGRRVQLALSEYNLGAPISWATADDQTWNYWATTSSWLDALVEV